MNTKEKSYILAQKCGWAVSADDYPQAGAAWKMMCFVDGNDSPLLSTSVLARPSVDFYKQHMPDLYEPHNMYLLSLVLEYAWEKKDEIFPLDYMEGLLVIRSDDIHGSMTEAADAIVNYVLRHGGGE